MVFDDEEEKGLEKVIANRHPGVFTFRTDA